MIKLQGKIAWTLVLVLAISSTASALAVDYDPGVTVGQYVKYGNFVWKDNSTLPLFAPLIPEWRRIEVTLVSGKNVTALHTLNYSTTNEWMYTEVYDIGSGTINGSLEHTPFSYVIAGNLNESDSIPPVSYGYIVNRTEIRSYFGGAMNRRVNILETTHSDQNFTDHWLLVYDAITGLMLEYSIEGTQVYISYYGDVETRAWEYSFSVVETNIDGSVIPESSLLPLFMTGALTLLVALFKKQGKKQSIGKKTLCAKTLTSFSFVS